MVIVYSAANNLEAHMIKGVLEQQEIPAYIQGEHLQSGAGELPAISGFVKVSVDDINRDTAIKIIKEWEAKDTSLNNDKSIPVSQMTKSGSSFLYIIFSFLIGAICMHLYLKPTISQNSLDYNKDGIDDEKWTYEGSIAVKSEHDRNLDGKYDDFWLYKNGMRLVHKLDNNFDGKFDTEDYFANDEIYYGKSDLDFDGEIDTVTDYATGASNYKTSMFSPKTKLIRKIQYFENDYLKSAELDTNADGKMDVVIEYDSFQEEVGRKPINSQ